MNKTTISSAYMRERKEYAEMVKQKYGFSSCKQDPLYNKYHSMVARCTCPNDSRYKYYGGRGIKVCDEWRDKYGAYYFIDWARSCTDYKDGLTIDRKDTNGDYSPTNCTWSTMKEQASNKRNVRIFIVNGERMTALDYCKYRGLPYGKFSKRLRENVNINLILDELEN